MKKNIAVVFGGFSGERVISEKSAQIVAKYLQGPDYEPWLIDVGENGWFLVWGGQRIELDLNHFQVNVNGKVVSFDGVFNAIHGTPGEDGKIQGYFDIMRIPYNNCGVLASSITFDKSACNRYLKASGVRVAESFLARQGDPVDENEIIQRVGLPCFVKPNDGGSSIGVTKVKHIEQLSEAIQKAQAEGVDALIERFLEGTELSCGCISEKGQPIALAVTEIVPANEFFDFDSKYLNSKTQEITPARIHESDYQACMELTEKIYHWLHCKGMIRVDFMLCKDGLYLIEVNTTPGLSEASIIPQQARHKGMDLGQFFRQGIEEMFWRSRKTV